MGREIRVLRVTTERDAALPTAEQLERADDGMTVSTVTAVADAREVVRSTPIDCVVCDAVVGSSTALDLLVELREGDPTLPFVVVLDTDAETTVEAVLAAGVTDCIRSASIDHQPESAAESVLIATRLRNAVAGARATAEASDAATPRRGVTQDTHEELVASEAKYRSFVEDVLNISHVGTFILDASFSVAWINDGIEHYFGVDRAEILGRDKRELIAERIKHRFEDSERFAERVIATYDDNSYVEQFECHVLPDGDREERWLEHWSYPIRAGPYKNGRVEHYVDITAQKHREAELAAERQLLDRLFETSPAGIVLLDADGRITHANKHGEVVLGVSQSAITDRSYDDPAWDIHDEHGEPISGDRLPFARVKRTAEPVFNYEHGITLSDGSKRWLSVDAAPLIADTGTVDRVVCVIRDMTEVRESERTLEQQNARLSEFASIVSHDLRNPLNVLAGSLELAEETGETVHFERCHRAATRMEQLIDDLLSLARHGNEIDRTEPVDLADLAHGCWENLTTEAATLQVDTDAVVTADRSRLEQLLENLFRNSVEHGGSAVTITIGELPTGFFIADNGPGIPVDIREDVFERGFSTRREGTGLGLSIVAQIAAAHGWTVDLADSDNGARFELTGVDLRESD